ncbi:MAG: hypothetical protein ACLP01_06415 [Solirubrobacteraceae bacterium]
MLAAFGVVLVAGGIVPVRGLRASSGLRDLTLALAVGARIAGYTLVANRGIEHGALISYLDLVFAATAPAVRDRADQAGRSDHPEWAVRRRGRSRRGVERPPAGMRS